MKHYLCLKTQQLTRHDYSVMPIQLGHIESVRQWRNAQMDVLRQAAMITPEQQERYYERFIWPQMEMEDPDTVLFSFFHENQHIGYGGLVHFAWPHKRAELSFLLDPCSAASREGYAAHFSSFLALMKEVSFDHLGLNRLFTETYGTREHHISVLEASGFRQEGVMREHVIIDGKATHSILHGYLRSDYEK